MNVRRAFWGWVLTTASLGLMSGASFALYRLTGDWINLLESGASLLLYGLSLGTGIGVWLTLKVVKERARGEADT